MTRPRRKSVRAKSPSSSTATDKSLETPTTASTTETLLDEENDGDFSPIVRQQTDGKPSLQIFISKYRRLRTQVFNYRNGSG